MCTLDQALDDPDLDIDIDTIKIRVISKLLLDTPPSESFTTAT